MKFSEAPADQRRKMGRRFPIIDRALIAENIHAEKCKVIFTLCRGCQPKKRNTGVTLHRYYQSRKCNIDVTDRIEQQT